MDKLQKLIDIEEIKNLKHRYFRAIDMADFDLLDNVFSKDITSIIEVVHTDGNLKEKKLLRKVLNTPFIIRQLPCIQPIILK